MSNNNCGYFVHLAKEDGSPEGEAITEHGPHGLVEAVQSCEALEAQTGKRHMVIDGAGNIAHFPSP